jgi:hypothetical protein
MKSCLILFAALAAPVVAGDQIDFGRVAQRSSAKPDPQKNAAVFAPLQTDSLGCAVARSPVRFERLARLSSLSSTTPVAHSTLRISHAGAAPQVKTAIASRPVSDAAAEEPQDDETDAADARYRRKFIYSGPCGTFHLAGDIGTGSYYGADGCKHLVVLRRIGVGDAKGPAGVPSVDAHFFYFLPDFDGGDSHVIAWAFARRPGPCCLFSVWKLTRHGWERFESACRESAQ